MTSKKRIFCFSFELLNKIINFAALSIKNIGMGQALLADIQKGLKGALMKQRIITRLIYTGCTTILIYRKA